MLGNFSYSNPTKLYFGEDSLQFLNEELPKYGKNILLTYGGGSIKANGIYDKVVEILKANGKNIVEDGGVMPNPTVQKLYEGCKLAKEHDVDLILAVGGGSVCDYSKAVSVSAHCEEDPWEKYYIRMEDVDNKIIPVGCVLTMVGTGSEMNGGAVITNEDAKIKGGMFASAPRFAILDPEYTMTLPRMQVLSGAFDTLSHAMETYFGRSDRDNTSDEVAEALLLMHREENNRIRKMYYHKAYFSLDREDGIENDALCGFEKSPEEIFMEQEEERFFLLTLERLKEALSCLTPTQQRRIRSRYLSGRQYRESPPA